MIPFQTIDWAAVPRVEHAGDTGTAHWQTVQLGGLRIRMVEYSANYLAGHWCAKGHVVHCLEGSFVSELDTGERHVLTAGTTYVASDGASRHRSASATGVKVLIVDGDFLA